jgi:RHS repeat-associated protein
VHHYYYDAESRPIQVDGTLGTCSTAAACYVYDANGLRVQKTIGSAQTSYLYDLSGNVVAEDYGSGWAPGYVYAGGQLIAEYKNSTTYFVHGNHLGSSSILTSVAGSVVDCNAFYPFGEQDISICISSNITSHKFTGDERDTETNLDHTWFRKYTSAQGRWMTPDPAGLAAVDPTNPQSWNRYAYVLNDPLDFADPLGLDCGDAGWEFVDVTGWIWNGEAWYPFSTTIWAQVKQKGCHDPQRTGGSRGGDGGGGTQTPAQAATQYCQQHGQLSFNIPFTHIPVTISLSATAFGNFSTTNDISMTFPPSAGLSLDITAGAPTGPNIPVQVGAGKNASVGTFLTPRGARGFSLSIPLSPTAGSPVTISPIVGNACGLRAGGR